MDNKYNLRPVAINLFDDGGGGDGAGADGATATSGAGNAQVGSDAGSIDTSSRDFHAEFADMVNGDYKEAFEKAFKEKYTANFQKDFDKRHKTAKSNEEQLSKLQPVIDGLALRYNTTDPAKLVEAIAKDDSLIEDAAYKKGMEVDQYREYAQLKMNAERYEAERREREQSQAMEQRVRTWASEAEQYMSETGSKLDVVSELQNPQIKNLLLKNVPFKVAYEVAHLNDIKKTVATQAEKKIGDNIKSNGARPPEVGTGANSSTGLSSDPSKWTNEQLKDIAQRVKRGERISL